MGSWPLCCRLALVAVSPTSGARALRRFGGPALRRADNTTPTFFFHQRRCVMMRALAVLALITLVAGCTSSPANDASEASDPVEPAAFSPIWADTDSAILRPGAPIGWCTFNFLFTAPNGTYYVGTAAHCTDGPGERIPLVGHGEIGTVVYDSNNATESSTNADFALIQLDDGLNLKSNPTMVNHAGPTGFATDADVAVGDRIEHHGYATVWGQTELTRDREGILTAFGDDYCAESPVWWGDSGSPVLHAASGKALGIVSRAGWVDCLPNAQVMGATLPYIFRELADHGWNGIELATI